MHLTALTEEEAREVLDTMRLLRKRSEEYYADFKMDEIPKSKKANLPLLLNHLDPQQLGRIDALLDWWDDYVKERTAKGKRSRYITPLVVMSIGPIFGGVIVAAIIKAFGL